MSPRQALIHVSENVIKPIEGKDYFGRQAKKSVLASELLVFVFSDGGFIDEIQALKSDKTKVTVIRLHREGFTFEGDSRSYVDGTDEDGLESYDLMLYEGEQEAGKDAIISLLSNTIRLKTETSE